MQWLGHPVPGGSGGQAGNNGGVGGGGLGGGGGGGGGSSFCWGLFDGRRWGLRCRRCDNCEWYPRRCCNLRREGQVYLFAFFPKASRVTHSSNNMALGWHTNFSSSHFFARAATFSSSDNGARLQVVQQDFQFLSLCCECQVIQNNFGCKVSECKDKAMGPPPYPGPRSN